MWHWGGLVGIGSEWRGEEDSMHSHQAEWLKATAGWVEMGKGRWRDPYQKMTYQKGSVALIFVTRSCFHSGGQIRKDQVCPTFAIHGGVLGFPIVWASSVDVWSFIHGNGKPLVVITLPRFDTHILWVFQVLSHAVSAYPPQAPALEDEMSFFAKSCDSFHAKPMII